MEIIGGLAVAAWVLVVPLLTAWLAGERGRDGFPWLVLALLSGPVALLAIGFADRAIGAEFKRCVECREPIRRFATRCPFCRTDLIAAEAAEAAEAATRRVGEAASG